MDSIDKLYSSKMISLLLFVSSMLIAFLLITSLSLTTNNQILHSELQETQEELKTTQSQLSGYEIQLEEINNSNGWDGDK